MDDLQSKITEDCTLWIDYDQIAFQAASAMEERSINAVHKASGRKMPFKNKTEFWGRSKKSVGGWLETLNLKNEEAGKPTFTKEDFEIEDVFTSVDEVAYVLQASKTKVVGLCKHVGLESYAGAIGKGETFRHHLELPKFYKGQRDEHKPAWLSETKDYLETKHNGEVVTVIEADDFLTKKQFLGWRNFKKTGKISHITASLDKDSLHTPGFLFNFNKIDGIYKHPEIIVIDESIGNIWLNKKGEVKGWGSYWLAYQLLIGDSTDNIRPYQDFGIKYGEKSFYNEVKDIISQAELFTFVKDKYHSWFPNGVEFTSWSEKQISISTDEWLETIFSLIYMHRVDNDPTTFAKMLQHYQSKA